MCPGRALTSPQPRHTSQPAPPDRPRDPCCKGRSRLCCHPLVLPVCSGTRPSNEAMESPASLTDQLAGLARPSAPAAAGRRALRRGCDGTPGADRALAFLHTAAASGSAQVGLHQPAVSGHQRHPAPAPWGEREGQSA